MKAKITEACISCTVCAGICPVAAISPNGSGTCYEVDPTKCIGCGACLGCCPVDAIVKIEGEK